MLLNLSILLAFLLLLIISISKWKIHPFIALILIALGLGMSLGMGGEKTVEVLLKGFSETLRWIAVIIILGAFIGEVLQETGGAFRISDSIVKRVGEKKLPWAMGFTGYLVSIPVFVDVAYILLQPVIESLSVKSKKPVLYIGLALAAGLTVSHTLIPPTPGPMAVASLLGVNIGRMLLINLIVAICAMTGGVLWVIYFVKNSWLEYDKKLSEAARLEEKEDPNVQATDKNYLLFDLLPILVPIFLIGFGSFFDFETENVASKIIHFISLPLVAVMIGAFIAVFQLKSRYKRNTVNRLVEQAILKSALVIMITGAGGSLGYVIRETGVQNEIVHFFSDFPFLGILLPFIVASILTISTGSITVSLVGTASMLGPMVDSLPVSPEMTAALIGCGSFCVFHANSSFFWLLNRLHEVPPKILYKTFTVQSLVMGISGLIGVLILKLVGF
ncbi:MAG: GntP family permease [Bacteroidetes bacterium]|nr:GntP family permease [Bacteroidota bacterium]